MSALRAGAVFAAAFMAGMSHVALPVARLIRMEVIERLFPALGNRSVVTMMRVIAIVDVAIKAVTAMKPGTGSDEQTAIEPVWPIVAVGRATVRGVVEITVGTVRGHSDVDANLSWGRGNRGRQTDSRHH